ncbi:P-loop NTPase fold protein [Natrialbaceae archaeon A-arb3/5]
MSDQPDDLNFLSDEPIASDEEDAFQHTEYVDALERILGTVEPPWHIGIFGKWGSGKTSIIRLLFSRIEEQDANGKTVCIEFDAWKHAEDSVRTELLLTLDQELGEHANKEDGLIGEDKITGQLYDVDEQKRAETDSLIEGVYNFLTHSSHLILIIGVLALVAVVSSFLGFDNISTSLLILIAAPLLVFMAEQLQTATTTLQRKFVYPRKEWSGAYERIFHQLIDKVQDETGTDRIIISIDNLDRCQSRTVYEVLVSLKTFMDVSPCIYIIPCDDNALKSHIQQIDHEEGTYFKEGQNTREFLRKFFQTTIRIPPMLADDIEVYAETQNDRLTQPYDPEVLDVLTKAYIKTPRRIKQGLNRVTALSMLAGEIEDSDAGLEQGRVTGNPAFLAKIAVLEEDYPNFYNALQENPRLLEDVDRFFTGDLTEDREKEVDQLFEETSAETSGVSNLRTFLKATRPTSVPDIKPFLHLSEPRYAGALDTNFVQLLRTNQINEVKQILNDVDDESEEPFGIHCTAIENILDEYDQEGRDQALFSTIESILEVFDQFDDTAQQRIADAVAGVLTVRLGGRFVERFNLYDLVWLLDRISERGIRTNLFTAFAETVVFDDEWQQNRLEAFTAHTRTFEDEDNDRARHPLPQRAKRTLSTQLLTLPRGDGNDEFQDSPFGEALEFIYLGGPAWGLLTDDLFEPLISAIEREEEESEFINVDSYLKLDNGASPRIRGRFLQRLLEYAPQSNENRASRTYDTLAEHLLDIEPDIDETSADELYDYIQEVVNSKNSKAIDIVEAGFYYHDSASDETQEQFGDSVAALIENWNAKHARKALKWANEYNTNAIFENSNVFTAYMPQVPEKFSNSNRVSTAVSQFSTRFESELNEDMERLIDSRDDDEQKLGADIFSSVPNSFGESQATVVDTCLKEARRAETDYRQSYLMAVAIVYSEIEESNQQTFIDRLEAFIDERTSSDYQAFKEVWEAIDGDVEPRYQRQLADAIIEALEDESLPPEELATVIYSVQGELSEGKLQRCVEILVNAVGDAKTKQARSIFELLSDCPDFTDSEDAILTRIESFLDQNSSNNAMNNMIDDLLTAVEDRGNPDLDRIALIREDHL